MTTRKNDKMTMDKLQQLSNDKMTMQKNDSGHPTAVVKSQYKKMTMDEPQQL